MLLEINEYNVLLTALRRVARTIDEDLTLTLIDTGDSIVFKFTKHGKFICVTYNSLKHYTKEDIIYHSLNMIRRKGNEDYYDRLKRTPL